MDFVVVQPVLAHMFDRQVIRKDSRHRGLHYGGKVRKKETAHYPFKLSQTNFGARLFPT